MDVCGLFIGDTTMTYGSLRSTLYRDYEKFPYGTFENNKNPTIKDYYSKVQEKCQQVKEQQKKGKQSCPFCRENKKRPLINYMRNVKCTSIRTAFAKKMRRSKKNAKRLNNMSIKKNITTKPMHNPATQKIMVR